MRPKGPSYGILNATEWSLTRPLLNMKKILVSALAAIAGVIANAVPVTGNLSVDFRHSDWSAADGQNSFTVGGVTATGRYNTVLFGIVPANLQQDGTSGLGVDSPSYNIGEDPNEVGPREILDIDFTALAGLDITGVWLTKIFEEGLFDDTGYVALFGAGNVSLGTINFTGNGNDADGNLWVSFGGAFDLTSAVFYGEGLITRDYSVAAFTTVEPTQTSVPDGGMTGIMLGAALLGLGVARRAKRNV